jgi:hypothetical protein
MTSNGAKVLGISERVGTIEAGLTEAVKGLVGMR